MDNGPLLYENFLGRPPGRLLRRGGLLVFLFFCLLVLLSIFLKYNEVIRAEVVVTSENPPVDLLAKRTGKLIYKNFEPGKKVNKNEILMVFDNPSNFDDILYLRHQIIDRSAALQSLDQLYKIFPSDLKLETQIHSSYKSFLSAYQEFILYNNLNQEEQESLNIESRLLRLRNQIKIKRGQLNASMRNYELSKQSFERQKELFEKGVVSRQQLDNKEQELLVTVTEISKTKEELQELFVDTLKMTNLSSKSLSRNIINASVYYSNLELTRQELLAKLNQWEDKNAIVSPITGLVTVFDIWNNYQNVDKNEHVLTVVPNIKDKIIGRCKVPIRNSAKLQNGQRALIKLESFPFREWGQLQGRVISISEIPKKGEKPYYSVYIEIPELITTYSKEIEFKREMIGEAKIILKETSLLKRVFYEFRGLWEERF